MEMGERKGGGREDFAKERERVVIFDLRPRATTLTPSPRTSKLPFEGIGIDGGEDGERGEALKKDFLSFFEFFGIVLRLIEEISWLHRIGGGR